jgi:hypothetical protein
MMNPFLYHWYEEKVWVDREADIQAGDGPMMVGRGEVLMVTACGADVPWQPTASVTHTV